MRASERELAKRGEESGVAYSRCPTSAEQVIPVLQALSDGGTSPISKDNPARVFVTGRGMVQFTVDDNGRVIEAVRAESGPTRPITE